MSSRSLRLLVAIFALAGLYGSTRQLRITSDAHLIYLQTRALLLHADADVARYEPFQTEAISRSAIKRQGHAFSVYGVGVSLVSAPIVAPFVYAGLRPPFVHAAASIPFAAASVLILYLACASLVPRRYAVGAAIAFAFGTTLWPIGTTAFWQIAPLAFLEAVGIWGLLSGGKRSSLWAGFGFGTATLVRPTAIWLLAAAGLYFLISKKEQENRLRSLIMFAAGAVPPIAAILIQNQWIWGHWSTGGFTLAGQGFRGDLDADMWAMSFGWWRGLFIYSPILLTCIPGAIACLRSRTTESRKLIFLFGGAVGMFVMYARWTTWWGGDSFYGYRYTLDLVPVLVVLGAVGIARYRFLAAPALGLLALSVATITVGTLPDSYMGWDAHLFPSYADSPLVRAWRSTLSTPGPAIARLIMAGAMAAVLWWAWPARSRENSVT